MDHLDVQPTLLPMFVKMDESAHTSDLKAKVKAEDVDREQHRVAVSLWEVFLEKSIPKNCGNCLASTVT